MIILVNFNSYLGGGETLAVRFSDYLNRTNIDFRIFCLKDSYIYNDLARCEIPSENILGITKDPNYYYLSKRQRGQLINELSENVPDMDNVHIVSFCARDLYTLIDLRKVCQNLIITHLILHDQDNLYVCQSLVDKVKSRFFHIESFSRKKQIEFNSHLLNLLSINGCTIPQCNLQVPLWQSFGIQLKYENVVPLPVCDFSSIAPEFKTANGKKIIWVGRIVDFKIPSLCAMISYVGKHPDYSLTIVGDGDKDSIDRYIMDNSISTDNISFVGQVDYSELPSIIKTHDIGYAMGTSIVEIGKFGIPVIMALGAPKKRLFSKEICGGLYADVAKGNVGENLLCGQSEDEQILIEQAINRIDADYLKSSQECFDCIRGMYDLKSDISKYLSIIFKSKRVDVDLVQIPSSSFVRRILFKYLM